MSGFTLVARATTAICVYANRNSVGIATLSSDGCATRRVEYRRTPGGGCGKSGIV